MQAHHKKELNVNKKDKLIKNLNVLKSNGKRNTLL